MKKTSLALLIPAVVLLAGCATLDKLAAPKHNYTDGASGPSGLMRKYAVVGYDGPIRPWNEVAVVTTDGTFYITAIDGKSMSSFREWTNKSLAVNGRYQLHLLPGDHVLEMGFSDNRTRVRSWSVGTKPVKIKVTAGQFLHLVRWEGNSDWGVNEYDGASATAEIKRDFNAFRKANPGDAD